MTGLGVFSLRLHTLTGQGLWAFSPAVRSARVWSEATSQATPAIVAARSDDMSRNDEQDRKPGFETLDDQTLWCHGDKQRSLLARGQWVKVCRVVQTVSEHASTRSDDGSHEDE